MLLAIETGYEACSVALIDNGHVAAGRHEVIGRGHAERLVPLISELLDEAAGGGNVDAITVDIGPGSFTGIRVGIAAARGLGLAWRVPVTGFSALPLVAARAFHDDAAIGALTVVMEAGRGELFVQEFARDLAAAAPPRAEAPEITAATAPLAIAGTGTARLARLCPGARRLSDAAPDAADVARLAPALRELPVSPLYVRAPDAKPAAAPVCVAP